MFDPTHPLALLMTLRVPAYTIPTDVRRIVLFLPARIYPYSASDVPNKFDDRFGLSRQTQQTGWVWESPIAAPVGADIAVYQDAAFEIEVKCERNLSKLPTLLTLDRV